MDPRNDHGKANQASEEPSPKRIRSGIDKGKGKMLATDDNGDTQSRYPGVQHPHFAKPLSIAPSQSMVLCEQQHWRALPHGGNPAFSSLFTGPPVDDFRQQISDFLYQNNIDPNVVNSASFQELLNIGGNGPLLQPYVPTVRDLRSRMLHDRYEKLQSWAANIKQFWEYTGCSLILDGWVDEMNGRVFLNVLVDCPLGTVYVQSIDVTFAVNDVQALEKLVERLIFEVGTEKVLQVISCSPLPWLDAVRERIKEKYQSIFWNISATYCLALMLERVASSISWVTDTIEQAKRVTRFIHSDPYVMDLLKKGEDNYLVKPARIKAATPFLTLENMLLRRKYLEAIFSSRGWKNSSLGSSLKGKSVANLVTDKSFWARVTLVVRGGMPIVNMLCLINNGNNDVNKLHMGILYETMDQMKETIREEIGKKKAEEFWVIIDEIWNQMLHSPVHAAGYYLNPKLFYTEDFVDDSEVIAGIMATILKIGGDQHSQSLIAQQLDLYRLAGGDFRRGMQERHNFSPVDWWRQFGVNYPELQGFAIRILGLSCNGASSCELRREVAEKLFTMRETHPSHEELMKTCFVSYNLNLMSLHDLGFRFNIAARKFDPLDDWVYGDY